jgi:hypothetical protein
MRDTIVAVCHRRHPESVHAVESRARHQAFIAGPPPNISRETDPIFQRTREFLRFVVGARLYKLYKPRSDR